eukprot:151335-Hanusia_phi.AAC.1
MLTAMNYLGQAAADRPGGIFRNQSQDTNAAEKSDVSSIPQVELHSLGKSFLNSVELAARTTNQLNCTRRYSSMRYLLRLRCWCGRCSPTRGTNYLSHTAASKISRQHIRLLHIYPNPQKQHFRYEEPDCTRGGYLLPTVPTKEAHSCAQGFNGKLRLERKLRPWTGFRSPLGVLSGKQRGKDECLNGQGGRKNDKDTSRTDYDSFNDQDTSRLDNFNDQDTSRTD